MTAQRWAIALPAIGVLSIIAGATGNVVPRTAILVASYVFLHVTLPASYQARHRRLACGNHRMVRSKARR